MNDVLQRQAEFIRRSIERYGEDRFDRTRVKYKNTQTPVILGCKYHGWLEITPLHHLEGLGGCKECMNENRRSVIFGFGHNDVCKGTLHPLYRTWRGAIERCYSERKHGEAPTYDKCDVCDEWQYFSKFIEWAESDGSGYRDGYALDKDILYPDNKVYSPQTCVFVPQEINNLIKNYKSTNGLPVGVNFRRGKYTVYLGMKITTGKKHAKFIGNFDVLEDAISAYKQAKESYVKEVATAYYNEGKITKRVYDSLIEYKVS